MGMDIYFMYPLDMEELKKDEKLNVVTDEGGYLIYLQENNEASIYAYNLEQYQDYFCMHSESAPLLKYMAEKYDLLIGGYGCLNDAGGRAWSYGSSLPEDSVEILFEEYATTEMIEFREAYGWSEEFIEHLKDIRSKNRQMLGMKETYKLNDVVRFEYCGPDYTISMSGRVIFVDNEHTLVHMPFYTFQQAADINRNCLDYESVEKITGMSVEKIKVYEFDRFIDMADPATFIPSDTFSEPIRNIGRIVI
jgi:hypothetical protein